MVYDVMVCLPLALDWLPFDFLLGLVGVSAGKYESGSHIRTSSNLLPSSATGSTLRPVSLNRFPIRILSLAQRPALPFRLLNSTFSNQTRWKGVAKHLVPSSNIAPNCFKMVNKVMLSWEKNITDEVIRKNSPFQRVL